VAREGRTEHGNAPRFATHNGLLLEDAHMEAALRQFVRSTQAGHAAAEDR
jgi:hypothetical protein